MQVMQRGATGIGGGIVIRWTQCIVQGENAQRLLMLVPACLIARHGEELPATVSSSCEACRYGKCDLGRQEHTVNGEERVNVDAVKTGDSALETVL
jgi:hypothetical protein